MTTQFIDAALSNDTAIRIESLHPLVRGNDVAFGLNMAPKLDPAMVSATINWGDNTPPQTVQAFPVGDMPGVFNVGSIHTYLQKGIYTIVITAKDNLNESAHVTQQVQVPPTFLDTIINTMLYPSSQDIVLGIGAALATGAILLYRHLRKENENQNAKEATV